MKLTKLKILLIITAAIFASCKEKQSSSLKEFSDVTAFSAIKGKKSKSKKIIYNNIEDELHHVSLKITGENKNFFKLESNLPETIGKGATNTILVYFKPDSSFIGIANAKLIINHQNNSKVIFPLRGLSTKALEGKNEPPLFDVVKTLNFDINLGWTTLANTIKPELQGDEIKNTLFKKADSGLVHMIPVARYSPRFELPFGYYTASDSLPVKYEVGVLADSKSYPEHQTLFPAVNIGNTSFDPDGKPFGFYTTSPTHDAFSEDIWNEKLFKKHAAHACRIYEVKNTSNQLVKNEYLVCFEEAKNGDYQDYVFLVKNVKPI